MFNFRKKRTQADGPPISIRDSSPSPSRKRTDGNIATENVEKNNEIKSKIFSDAVRSTPSIISSTSQRRNLPIQSDSIKMSSADDLCSGFEPQAWKKDRCRKCFRLRDQHGFEPQSTYRTIPIEVHVHGNSSTEPSTSASALISNGKITAKNSKSLNHSGSSNSHSDNSVSKRATVSNNSKDSNKENDADVSATYILAPASSTTQDDSKRRTKLVILKAEVSVDGKPSEQVSMETSIMADSPSNSRPPSRSSGPSSRRSLSPPDESYRSAASSAADYATASSGYDPLSRTVSWESVASTILDDDKTSMVTAASGGGNLSERCVTPTESLDEKMSSLKSQLKNMEEKCSKLLDENDQLKISQRMSSNRGVILNVQSTDDEINELKRMLNEKSERENDEKHHLKSSLVAAQQFCDELMDENGTLKIDIRGLQQELSEMNDQYREDEIEEFRELQHELDQTAKNCRVLQFKLRKSERKCDQTEADRKHLEEKLKEYLAIANGKEQVDSPRLRELESELRVAKEVSVRLHNELEVVDEKRCKLEDENFYLREKVREIETREKLMEQSLLQQRKLSGSMKNIKDTISPSNSRPNSAEFNTQQLFRDLQDALERETDLREQLKFAEEDIQAARKKLSDMETENEGLVQQLTKLTTSTVVTGGARTKSGKPPMKRSFSEGHAQIELELAEHEAHVLKSKLERVERENEHLLSKNTLLAKEVKKVGGKMEFSDDDLMSTLPDTYYKHKIKMLEEEIGDWKLKFETIQKTEADQDTARRIGKISRSRSSDSSELDLHRKVELVEQEAGVLRLRIKDLEMENERLCGENKRLSLSRKQSTKSTYSLMYESQQSNDNNDSAQLKEKLDQTQKDIRRFVSRIAELEKEKEALNKEVDRRKKLENIKKESFTSSSVNQTSKLNLQTATQAELRSKVQDLMNENANIKDHLNGEQKKLSELENQLADYKQIVSQSENQKIITMASKIDVLTNQLKEAQSRFENMQKKFAGQSDKKYEEVMKEQLDYLGKSIVEENSRIKVQQQEELAQELQNSNQLMKYVEGKIESICKQIEKMESEQHSPKPSPRLNKYGRSLSQTLTTSTSSENAEKMLNEMVTLKLELNSLKSKVSERKESQLISRTPSIKSARPMVATSSTSTSFTNLDQLSIKCQQQENLISELKEQLEVSKKERISAHSECETATARLLQSENRWTKEMDKLKSNFENQVKDLTYDLNEAKKLRDEKISLLQDRENALQEKSRRLNELERKNEKLENELKTKYKDLQDKLDAEKRRAKEFETKYQKLESLYENEKQKSLNEKDKLKQDILDSRKKYEELQSEFDKFKMGTNRKEQLNTKDKVELENKIRTMQDDLKEVENKVTKKVAENASFENKKLLSELSMLKKKAETDMEEWKVERSNFQTVIDQKSRDMEFRLDELERMKKETNLLKSRIIDQKQQLEETRNMRDEAREELSKLQQSWTREKAELSHKKRQEEKVQQAEQHAMQLKYESRMKILEDSSKRIQSQLTQIRRERDQMRESLIATERKLLEVKEKYEGEEKSVKEGMSDLAKKADNADSIKSQLEKELVDKKVLQKNYDIDKRLWSVEREQFLIKIQNLESGTSAMLSVRSRSARGSSPSSAKKDEKEKLLEQAVEIGNEMRHQLNDVKETYESEIGNYKQQIEQNKQEFTKEKSDLKKKIKELQENVRIMDIDRRNMLSSNDEHDLDKNILLVERDTLLEKFHDSEIHQLANKYKLDKVAEQLTNLHSKMQQVESSAISKREINDGFKKAFDQLATVRDDMGKIKELGKLLDSIEFADETASISSKRSNGSRRSTQKIEIDTFEKDKSSDLSVTKDRSPRSTKTDLSLSDIAENNSSRNADHQSSSYETRLAELRLRSTSPAPRKITNYPDPPPSMIINVKNAVQYNDDGSRYWARRSQIKRSTSFDPAPVSSASFDISDTEESKSTRSHAKDASSDAEDNRRNIIGASEDSDISSTGSQSPRSRRKIIDIFATLRKRKSKDRRKLFGHTKAHSIETSEVGHTIGAIAVQMFPPAVTPANLPESMQTSSNIDEPPRLAKSSSGSSLFSKLRNRSGSRGRLTKQSSSVDSGSEPPSGQTTPSQGPSVLGSKTNSQDNVTPIKDRYASLLAPTPSISSTSRNVSSGSTSTFRRLKSSYRSLSAKYLPRV